VENTEVFVVIIEVIAIAEYKQPTETGLVGVYASSKLAEEAGESAVLKYSTDLVVKELGFDLLSDESEDSEEIKLENASKVSAYLETHLGYYRGDGLYYEFPETMVSFYVIKSSVVGE